ncbi:conjugal transfer pilus assembly protein TraE [Vibrio crassostreae]|nr:MULTISPECIES: type IV conjugative transfer system protein TraE [Vibrio]OMO27602.1 type IV conjugative transfer system protein TraE [Vibrio sp. 10N.222.47.A9]PMN22569.1 type IV conjugative transfer system protein TraE [Vibrio splendidus]PMO49764.1 type IV conjugative transfer system protein TraE [Vibrio splendidus]CAK1711595.1 conjugal transfer pilus assembly protein TraE [Vibrio crassostreae]CAK1750706.1 conjugal transfer pilus assembly protein TraE [Vibrio crassostreae]
MDPFVKRDKLAVKSLLNLFLSAGFLVMLITNLVLGYTSYQALTHQSRTLVPPTLSQAFTVSDGAVDEPYLEQMADYLLYLKLNITPASVGRQFGQLLEYLDETSWYNVQPKLLREATVVKKDNISSQFSVESVRISLDTLQVQLYGKLQKHVGQRALDPEMKWYQVNFSYDQGVIGLLSIEEVEVNTDESL